ncbi:protein of unknown function [Pararobbsia alpina]
MCVAGYAMCSPPTLTLTLTGTAEEKTPHAFHAAFFYCYPAFEAGRLLDAFDDPEVAVRGGTQYL